MGRIFALITISLIIAASSTLFLYHESRLSTQHSTTHLPVGIIVPLYFDPNSSWGYLATLHSHFSRVPMTVVINPDNGPGNSYMAEYARGISSLESSGINVIGYIYTSYGAVPENSIKAQVQDYRQYGINGIFLDEVGDNSSTSGYYENITSMCRSMGDQYIVGNPGIYAPASITDNFNLTVLYENPGLPPENNLSAITNGTARNFSALIAISSELPNELWFNAASSVFSYVYVTDFGLPNPYLALPTYLNEELQELSLS